MDTRKPSLVIMIMSSVHTKRFKPNGAQYGAIRDVRNVVGLLSGTMLTGSQLHVVRQFPDCQYFIAK